MSYKIIRFTFDGSPRTVKRGLTLEEAQAHCRREDTHGEGWFDGYDEDRATCLADDDDPTSVFNTDAERDSRALDNMMEV